MGESNDLAILMSENVKRRIEKEKKQRGKKEKNGRWK